MELDKLAPALVALQADLSPVEKSAANPFFKSKYAPLPEVMKAVQPLLAKHKLAISQFPTTLDGVSALRTILLHESGQLIEDTQLLLLTKQDPQAQGSATTYARRYGVMSVLGLVADEDDDGNAASRPVFSEALITKTANEDGTLARAKGAIFAELNKQGYNLPVTQKAFITKVLKHSTIENLDEADEVMDALENEAPREDA